MVEIFQPLQLLFGRRHLLSFDVYVLLWIPSQARGKLSHHLSKIIKTLNFCDNKAQFYLNSLSDLFINDSPESRAT